MECLFNGYERLLVTLIGCLEPEEKSYPNIENLSDTIFNKMEKYDDWEVTNLPKDPT